MRVLHLRNTCGYYGAERCITGWMGELAPRGIEFDLAIFDHPDPSVTDFLDAARAAGARTLVLPRSHLHLPRVVAELVRRIRTSSVDLIHAHETRSHGVAWLVGGLTATPAVATVHGYVERRPRSRRMNSLNQSFLGGRRFAALTVPTRALATRWPRDAVVLPNGVAAPAPTEPPRAPSPDPPIFGVVARLSPEKGLDVFLDAVASLPEAWRFEVCGDGPERDTLAGHPAFGRVRWLGFRADAVDRMREWTAFVLPSRSEGLPLTVLEAMARRVSIVASAVGGIPDAIESGRHGLLIPPDDPPALASAMRATVADPAAAADRAEAAWARFDAEFRLDRVADRLGEIYRRVAAGRGGAT